MNLAAIKGVIEQFDPPWDADTLLARDVPLCAPTTISPNGHCRLLKAQDGWLAINLAREDDALAVPAWLEQAVDGWDEIEACIAQRTKDDILERAILLGMPVADVDATPSEPQRQIKALGHRPASGARVLDLSALWAGPLCGRLLAEAGADVTKLESQSRPDPTPIATPQLDHRLNGLKRRISSDLRDQTALFSTIKQSDVLITSARPVALARLGMSETNVFAANPRLIWIAITAHGWHGDNALRVGFGDDCAASGGLVHWRSGTPNFIGDALADPLTGLLAANEAIAALNDGCGRLIDISLAGSARWFAQEARK